MKKLFVVLFCALIVIGCNNNSYEIDYVATAKAPWKVGATVRSNKYFVNRVEKSYDILFLGITSEGYILLQDFYNIDRLHDIKRTEPYIIMDKRSLKTEAPYLYHGKYIIYDYRGNISLDCLYKYGTTVSQPCAFKNLDGTVYSERTTNYDQNTGQYKAKRVIYFEPNRPAIMEIEDSVIFGDSNISGTTTNTFHHKDGPIEEIVIDTLSRKIISKRFIEAAPY